VRYSERPELWDSTGDLFADVWPEYNHHGQVLNRYWDQLYDVFPDWQFFLCDRARPPQPQGPLSHHSRRTLRPLDPPRRVTV
jgi:hypothetical protein